MAARMQLFSMIFADIKRAVRDQFTKMFADYGFDADRESPALSPTAGVTPMWCVRRISILAVMVTRRRASWCARATAASVLPIRY